MEKIEYVGAQIVAHGMKYMGILFGASHATQLVSKGEGSIEILVLGLAAYGTGSLISKSADMLFHKKGKDLESKLPAICGYTINEKTKEMCGTVMQQIGDEYMCTKDDNHRYKIATIVAQQDKNLGGKKQ